MVTTATLHRPRPIQVADAPKPKAGRIDIVTVPERLILAIRGTGLPPGGEFQEAIAALYSVAYTAKFDAKARGLDAPKVQMLECLWDMADATEPWKWRLFIEQLPPLDVRAVKHAIAIAAERKPDPLYARLEVTRWREGLCAQTLHIGPYDRVGEVYSFVQSALPSLGYHSTGMPHEIYLNDPRRVGPEKTKTLIRIPIARL